VLQEQVAVLEGRNRELATHNERLSARLEEEIQQGEYFAAKLDEINAEVLEERVDCLTHLNAAKEHRIDALLHDLADRDGRVAKLAEELAVAERAGEEGVAELLRKEE
jgi:predicted RNase H-like nuclease (RuvC/YqgF family)